ncbi:MAG: amidohydrolase family protein [Candidatus Nanopelagicales bacterium]
MSTVLAPDRIITPHASARWIAVTDGRIEALGTDEPPPGAERVSGTMVPGFVDIHCHGGGGAAFESGDPEQARVAADCHRRHGTTTVIASLVSASTENMARQITALVPLCRAGVIAGIHLEGPWLADRFRGAHDPTQLRDPSPGELETLVAAGEGYVRMVTLAPERPGAIATIRECRANSVVAAIGHTDATYEQTMAAIDAGATVATHLFNAMRRVHHRHPGPIPALTEDPRVTVELIADGVHMAPPLLHLAERAAAGRVALVTDAMAAAGEPDGAYVLGGLAVEVIDGVARLADGGAIAGSTLTLDRAVRLFAEGAGLEVAVAAATATPAQALGLDAGELVVGAPADLVLLDDDLSVARVWSSR